MRIAISGLSGCGNTTVSKIVAHKLRLKRINYTLRNLARELKKPFKQVQGEAWKKSEYDYAVDGKQAQFAVANKNCVLATRLAIWVDDKRVLEKIGVAKNPDFGLKIWLEVPLKERARRIAKREKKPFADVLSETRKRDEENAERYKKLYGIMISKKPAHTLVVDAEKNSAEKTAELIIQAAKAAKKGKLNALKKR